MTTYATTALRLRISESRLYLWSGPFWQSKTRLELGFQNDGPQPGNCITLDDQQEISASREALLRYCELDTWAMVKVWEKLKEVAE